MATMPHARSASASATRDLRLDDLVGAPVSELRALYMQGTPADPRTLGTKPRGLLLGHEPLSSFGPRTRSTVELISKKLMPWQGKWFSTDGTRGGNRILGVRVLPFHVESAKSKVDGARTTILRYSDPALGNRWPARAIVDELRTVGDGVAIGTASLEIRGEERILFWWGLTTLSFTAS